MPYRPPDWIPRTAEPIVYVPPCGDLPSSALYGGHSLRYGHRHIMLPMRGVHHVDARDIFPMPGWRDYQAAEDAELADEQVTL
jgi:hypothetical protein